MKRKARHIGRLPTQSPVGGMRTGGAGATGGGGKGRKLGWRTNAPSSCRCGFFFSFLSFSFCEGGRVKKIRGESGRGYCDAQIGRLRPYFFFLLVFLRKANPPSGQ